MDKGPKELVEKVTGGWIGDKLVIIPIGLPGSGKSSFTETIRGSIGYEVAVHSTDSFFVDKAGKYNFDSRQLGRFHRKNLEAFKLSLLKRVPVIIVDNTNLRARDRNKYTKEAEKAGYEVQMVVIGEFTDEAAKIYAKRNKHGVPLQKIMEMASKANIPEGAL